MKPNLSWICSAVLALPMLAVNPAWGQAFSSGSTGADGPLTVSGTVNVTVRPGGVYNYTTVTLNNGAVLNFVKGADNSPVVLLATGDVTLGAGATISVSGNASPGGSPAIGGNGGPGGFAGGNAAALGAASTGSPGQGPGGGQPTSGTPGAAQRGSYGAPNEFVSLIPLFGGSGGSGGGIFAGAGGGGAILIASSTRISFGNTASQVVARGGDTSTGSCNSGLGSGGSGGAIRLVAPQIIGPGQIRAQGGNSCGAAPSGDGRIRLEAVAMDFTGAVFPVPSVSSTLGPVSPLGSPALVAVPTLAITSIGGQSLPATTAASYFVPDIALPSGTTNPVPIGVSATNTPIGAPTAISVRLIPQTGSWTDVPVTNQTGTFSSSSGSADVTFPVGRVSVVQAIASFTLTGQTASLFPLIDGEPVERVLMAATPGQASTLSLVTRSGKEVRLDQMRREDQVRVALAWSVLKEQAN